MMKVRDDRISDVRRGVAMWEWCSDMGRDGQMERERDIARGGWMNEQERKGQTKEFCIYMILLFPYI
jgi:hypothetical protein